MMYAVDDVEGTRLTVGTYCDCVSAAHRYLSSHPNVQSVTIYEVDGEEAWTVQPVRARRSSEARR